MRGFFIHITYYNLANNPYMDNAGPNKLSFVLSIAYQADTGKKENNRY